MATLTASGIDCSNGTLNGQYTGTTANNTSFPIGSYLFCGYDTYDSANSNNQTVSVWTNPFFTGYLTANYGGTAISGTWRCRGCTSLSGQNTNLVQRYA